MVVGMYILYICSWFVIFSMTASDPSPKESHIEPVFFPDHYLQQLVSQPANV
jgi:hypothetical protein